MKAAALAPFMDDDRTAPLARALADAALFAAHRASQGLPFAVRPHKQAVEPLLHAALS